MFAKLIRVLRENSKKHLKDEKGMTLIEIMIVLGIIGTVMAFLVGGLFSQGEQANIDLAGTQVKQLVTKVKLYKQRTGDYPKSWDDLLDNGLIEEVPEDPWKNEMILEVPGSHGNRFEIWSEGPDENDESDNITSWKKS
jgi:general secretion pathway protein G